MPTTALPVPSPAEWSSAAEALADGDTRPMRDLLQGQDLPLRLIDLFSAALGDAAVATAHAAAYTAGEVESLDHERATLLRVNVASLDEAKKITNRLRELEGLMSSANQRREQARVSGLHLVALHHTFHELFGQPKPTHNRDLMLPGATSKAFSDLDIAVDGGETWRDCLRGPEAKAAKRKIRASGFTAWSRA